MPEPDIRDTVSDHEIRIECLEASTSSYPLDELTPRERFRRAKYHNSQRYPLLEWGVTDEEALNYCQLHGFDFGGLYKLFKSVSCWCCPLKPYKELKALRDNFPDLWQRLLEMDSKSPYPHPKADLLKELREK